MGKQDAVKRMDALHLMALAVVPVLMVSVAILTIVDIRVVFEPPLLLFVLNALFVSVMSLVVAYISATNYLRRGSLSFLFLGCGVLAFGGGNAVSGWLIGAPGGPNAAVTVHNAGALCGSIFHVISAASAGGASGRIPQHRRSTLALAYLGVLVFTVLLTIAGLRHAVPPFFVQQQGPTLLRQMVLGGAVALFAVSSFLLMRLYSRSQETSQYWYSLALALIAVGLAAVFLQKAVGSPIGWVGRSAQYLSGIYFLTAVLVTYTEGRSRIGEERLRSVFSSSPDAIVIIGSNGDILECNQSALSIHGCSSRDELLGKSVLEFVAREDRGRVMDGLTRTLGQVSVKDMRCTLLTADGRGFSAEVSASTVRDPYGNPTGFVVVARDVTERRRAEEALMASEERYRSLLEGVPVGLYRTTPEGQILDVNPALVKMLGYPDLESLREVNVVDLYQDPEERGRWQARTESQATARGAEVQLRCRDGTPIWVRNAARAVRDADDRVAYYEGYMEDITQRKEAQAAMIQAEKLAVAGRLAASLTHEINNPLQSVIGCLGLAEEALAEGGDAGPYMQVARQELQRAARVVDQLRDLHRRPTLGEREDVHVNALLEHVLMLSRKQCEDCRVEVVWTPAADLPPLLLVADQIEQAFLNLLLNALDAMPEGGRLRVSTGRTRQPAGADIVLADNGMGIDPHILPHIFEPFYTTKSEGLGLGLFITRNIVEEHGGRIEVESRIGEGTTCTVWLPA